MSSGKVGSVGSARLLRTLEKLGFEPVVRADGSKAGKGGHIRVAGRGRVTT